MKRIIFIMCTVTALMFAQDAAGQYKLSGVDVLYTFVARGDAGTAQYLTVTDAYGFGITQVVAEIPAGAPFTTQAMRLTDAALSAININLNVTLNEDGSGSIAEGSYYPDVNTLLDENGNCVTEQEVLPVTDQFTYQSMGNGMNYAGMVHPGINVLGLPGISGYAGQELGLLGLSGSLTFEDYPMIPSHPTLCGPDGNCFPFTVGDIDGSGTLEIYPDVNLLGIPEYVPGGAPLTGVSGGFFLKDGLNADGLSSVYPGNTTPDFHLEWHGVDGVSAGLGQGPYAEGAVEEDDEDGDGTWFDRTIGIPAIVATYMNPACGFNNAIYGDVTDAFTAAGMEACIDYVDVAASGYLMDPSGALATWGNFLTAHGALVQQALTACATNGLDSDQCFALGYANPAWMADDSGYDIDPSCLGDMDPTDCSGRLTMNFDIPCVKIIEAREVVAEFIEVGGGGCGTGDMNADGTLNVLDVVALVNLVLSGGGESCEGDMNVDGTLNVLDVVALVNTVLSGGRVDEATSAEFNVIGNKVTMTADGYVGAVEMTLSHGNDFAIKLTDDALIAEYLTNGNTTKLMIVEPTGNSMFTAEGEFTIENVVAASNSESYMQTSINTPQSFNVGAAYPNPFNPTTQIALELNNDAYVSVKVFNTNGQMVDMITNGQMASGAYSLTWDGTNAASGVYLIQTTVGSELHSQKIMLIK